MGFGAYPKAHPYFKSPENIIVSGQDRLPDLNSTEQMPKIGDRFGWIDDVCHLTLLQGWIIYVLKFTKGSEAYGYENQ
jgi:hypothetical protein